MKIGFIGLGNMGSGMAANLLRYCLANGHTLTVLDLNPSAVERLVSAGAISGASVQEIASQSDILFTSLPSSKQVNQVALGSDGILQNAKADAIWIETSTSELAEWSKIRALAPDHLTLVDGPVTGGAEGAAVGTLTMLLGIDEPVLEVVQPILASFTKRAVRMGPPGAGYVTKLIQLHLNYLVAQGIGEALMLGAKAELDLNVLHNVLQNSCAQSYVVDRYIPMVLDGTYDPSFALGLATKDMRLITGLGDYLSVDLTLANTVYQTYQKATEKYGESAPHLAVLKLIEESGGKLLRSNPNVGGAE
ncbi:NAD(P)-dependent oxidoreductase [Pseudomonas sp. CDFA 553]|uniref:NAD(P)-dependent oxidoreductase n=1 Tax=Pseudomonas quasicaspiana TaxID=2829821 RepID=UPI001E638D78|nr:NAD(P)-dependent oxidoreductase [Pseudomonas quasicaspiana]MCD5987204.1 NAD(P)-dependent oxidoreductase [Pseudomonas quasicaspiana]